MLFTEMDKKPFAFPFYVKILTHPMSSSEASVCQLNNEKKKTGNITVILFESHTQFLKMGYFAVGKILKTVQPQH